MTDKIKELKSQWLDCLLQIESLQKQIQAIQQEIIKAQNEKFPVSEEVEDN